MQERKEHLETIAATSVDNTLDPDTQRLIDSFDMENNPYVNYAKMVEQMSFSSSTQTQYIREEPKVQRNEPCICGSGKKYKKCCLNRIDENR